MPPERATVLARGGHVHALDGSRTVLGAVALAADRVLALGSGAGDLDGLAGGGTLHADLDGLCVLPGLADAHVHQVEAEQDLDAADLRPARSVAEAVGLLRAHAERTPPGAWVVSQRGWHESQLAEGRLPVPAELDGASRDHPVMLRRGSMLAVLNSAGRRLAGGAADDGGVVRGLESILALRHGGQPPDAGERARALERVCARHASRGLVGVRDAGVRPDEVAVYERLAGEDRLGVRTDVMMLVGRDLDRGAKLALLDDLGPPPGQRGPFLRIDGVKLFADGHVADAAVREPLAGGDGGLGVLHMDAEEVEAVAGRAVALGWRVGCHAVGDRALDAVLDGFERVAARHRDLPPGWLAVEHAVLADEAQRERAAALGVGVTVQHPLLDAYALPMIEHWGRERAEAASPVRGWLASGALVVAGSDGHVAPFDPLRSIAGLATRATAGAGVLGGGEAVPLEAAVRLYTVAGGWLTPWRTPAGGLAAGAYADLVAFEDCLLATPPGQVGGLEPVLTVCGGRATHDPRGMWPV